MNKKELELAAQFLDLLSRTLERNTCNDFWFARSWTAEEQTKFVKQFHDENGDPEEYEDGMTIIPDFCVAHLLAKKLRQHA